MEKSKGIVIVFQLILKFFSELNTKFIYALFFLNNKLRVHIDIILRYNFLFNYEFLKLNEKLWQSLTFSHNFSINRE